MLFTSQILSGFSPWAQLPKAALPTFFPRNWEAVKVGRAAQAEKFASVKAASQGLVHVSGQGSPGRVGSFASHFFSCTVLGAVGRYFWLSAGTS